MSEYIFITASKPKSARGIYFDKLAKTFVNKYNYKVIVIYDKHFRNYDFDGYYLISKTWPNRRPTKLSDFIYIISLIKKYKPFLIISSFGSVNVSNIVGTFLNVNNRVNFILSTPLIFNDQGIFGFLKKTRKKIIYKTSNLYVANTSGVLSEIQEYYNYNFRPNLILPNLIDDMPSNYPIKRKKQLVIAGNLSYLKGHDYLIKQFEELLMWDSEMKLIIIGDGLEKNKLITKYSYLVDSGHVVFTGKLSRDVTLYYIQESLVHISASIREAFGFVSIEALMLSIPILCTKTSGSKFILKENFNGEFFNLYDKKSLYESLRTILQNWEKYSNNARIDFLERFSLNNKIQTHASLILKKINAL